MAIFQTSDTPLGDVTAEYNNTESDVKQKKLFPTEEIQIDEEEKNLLEKFFAEDDDNAVSGNYKVDGKELKFLGNFVLMTI